MRYAIVSDIHANWQAWSAVRDDIRMQRVDTMVCLGDIVGYGPSPTRVFADLLASCDNFVLGNHDAAAAGGLDPSTFNANARRSAKWTAAQFDRASLKRLGSAPLVLEDEEVLFVHAETPAPDEFGYVETVEDARACFEATDKRFTFIGHTHRPLVFALAPDGTISKYVEPILRVEEGTRYLVNVGSVGDPGDGTDQASYCIFDSDAGEISLRKVAFDVAAFRAEVERVSELSLPWFLQRHEGEAVRPSHDQAVAAGKVAGSKIRVPASHGKIRIKSSALATHAGDSLRVVNEAAKTSAKKPKRSSTGILVTSICVAAIGAMAGIHFYYNRAATAAAPGAGTAAAVAPAAGSPATAGAAPTPLLPAFGAIASREERADGKAHGAELAVDGNPETRWCSGDKLPGHWLQVDFGTELSLTGVRVTWEHPDLAYGYKIEGSGNTRTWDVLAAGSGKSADPIPFAVRTSHVRISVTNLPDQKWASIAEVTFFDADGRAIRTAPPAIGEAGATVKRERLVVVSATYGVPGDAKRTRDVRDKLQRIIDGGASQFTVGDLAQGDDPAHGVLKTLEAACTAGDRRITLKGQDRQVLSLAEFSSAQKESGLAAAPRPATAPAAGGGTTTEPYTSLDLLGQIAEAKDYRLVYDLDLAKLGKSVPYAVDNATSAPRFDRVAYLVEVKKAKEPARYLWVSMDAFTTDATKLGVPTVASGIRFQQSVANITVVSDAPGIRTGERIGAGNIEFWPNNYNAKNSADVPGANAGLYDIGDSPADPLEGYGSMQVHHTAEKQTLFAINNWRNGAKADIGIGNGGGKNPDWTFSNNAHYYVAKRLRVFVRPAP